MSLRSRRALWAVSSSTSTTILPAAMCKPPAKRSSEETSAFRQQGLVIESLVSSSFTDAVIAMALSNQSLLDDVGQNWGQFLDIMRGTAWPLRQIGGN